VIVKPAKRIHGAIVLPGDKSISHRAAMVAALAKGTTRVTNFSTSADCATTLSCLEKLGVCIDRSETEVEIRGVSSYFRQTSGPIDCGNSGTTMRLLAGILAGENLESTLTGDESLRSRPMQRIIEPLTMMGATIDSDNGHAPLKIKGRDPLNAISYELPVASAQVKSCLLFAALAARGRTEITEQFLTRDHTERMLQYFFASVETRAGAREGSRIVAVKGPTVFGPRSPARMLSDLSVPGDISSAGYFLAAAALLPESSIEIADVGVNPTRTLYLKQLRACGLDVEISNARDECNEPVGTISARSSPGSSGSADPLSLHGSIVPQLIDELPLLAVVGSQIEGGIEIRDAAELRTKESDRIAATVQNLRAMGAEVDEFKDGLRVTGPAPLRGAEIDPRGDHRIAMAFAVAGLIARGETEIKDAECVAVSFPEFFELLESVIER
jgi:3-phosphoshikimate 1-carboxyvinyltransferase